MNRANLSSSQNLKMFGAQNSKSTSALKMQMCFGDATAARQKIESFISEGFTKAFSAKVSSFLPLLIQVGDHKARAALGLRSATSPLFIEQYLTKPIDLAIDDQQHINRGQIAELGNLYSSNRRFTLTLFMTMSVALFLADFQYLCFSGTDKVRDLLTRVNVNFDEIGDAQQADLTPCKDAWGDYYLHQPKVCVVKLLDVMTMLESNSAHQLQMNALSSQITVLAQELKKL
jgi:hypothetical protein